MTTHLIDDDGSPESEQRLAHSVLRQRAHVADSQRGAAERREADLARAMLVIAESLRAAVESGDDVAVTEAAIRAETAIRLRCEEVAR